MIEKEIKMPGEIRYGIEKGIITFNEIRYGEYIFKLIKPIAVEIISSIEGWVLYYEKSDVLARASTLEECIDDFQEYLYVLWKEYANKKDDELTDSGQILKYKLLNSITITNKEKFIWNG